MGICRRKVLLDHFGEHRGPCSGVAGEQLCDVCCEGQVGFTRWSLKFRLVLVLSFQGLAQPRERHFPSFSGQWIV